LSANERSVSRTSGDAASPPTIVPVPPSALVTGAAGFIGSHLVERLVAAGSRVVGVDNFCSYYPPVVKRANVASVLDHDRFSLVEADLTAAELDPLVAQVDAVFHLAGQPGVRASWGPTFASYLDANVLVTQRLLEALCRHPRPTVFASSSSVYGESTRGPRSEDGPLVPKSPYGLTKATAEQLIDVYRRDLHVPVVALRYFSVFGPRQRPDMAFQRFITAADRDEELVVFGDGEQSRDFTFVGDVVDATLLALGAPDAVYNVGGGAPSTVNEAIAVIGELTGRLLRVRREEMARGDVGHTWADTIRARTQLNWRPRTSLVEGLARQVDYVRRAHGTVVA
jgi:nucleoside-diphosphate-sugar epimerase